MEELCSSNINLFSPYDYIHIFNSRKRQNLYYVKVQERVSTLDAADDYVMTVTTICGPSKVILHNMEGHNFI